MGKKNLIGKTEKRQERRIKNGPEGKCEEGGSENGKKKEEIEKRRDIKNGFSCCEVELLGCCHATDGLWEFCCTMMTVALAGREQPEFKSTHYESVCACKCVLFCVSVTEHMVKIVCQQNTRSYTYTLSWMIKPEHNSIQGCNRILSTLRGPGYLELQAANGYS